MIRSLQNIRFDLTTIRLFIATVEHGSITRAAEQQCVAVTAASRRIAELEAQFGVALFERRPHGMTLTNAGRSLLAHARSLMHSVELMHNDASAFVQGDKGVVRVAACTSAVLQFLPDDVKRHRAAHPWIDIDLREMQSRDVVRSVVQGATELGIHEAGIDAASDSLNVVPYRTDRLVLVAPHDHPLAGAASVDFAGILPYEVVGLAEGTAMDAMLHRVAAHHGATLRIPIRTRSFDSMLSMIQTGMGVGIVPSRVADWFAAGPAFRRVPIAESWAERRFMVCHRGNLSSSASTLLAILAGGDQPGNTLSGV